jgi:hypothetical protein
MDEIIGTHLTNQLMIPSHANPESFQVYVVFFGRASLGAICGRDGHRTTF